MKKEEYHSRIFIYKLIILYAVLCKRDPLIYGAEEIKEMKRI